jgi:small redox-active disulfide protein 2
MEIKILGTGCSKCTKLEENVRAAVKELGIDASVEKVEDLIQIMKYGVMSTPGLVINDSVKSVGKVLTTDDIKKLLGSIK